MVGGASLSLAYVRIQKVIHFTVLNWSHIFEAMANITTNNLCFHLLSNEDSDEQLYLNT